MSCPEMLRFQFNLLHKGEFNLARHRRQTKKSFMLLRSEQPEPVFSAPFLISARSQC